MTKIKYVMSLCLFTLLIASCSTMKVERTSGDTVTDFSGRWNDTDSRLVAEEMVTDSLARPWLADFQMAQGKKPVVIVGTIRNKSSEHIQTSIFVKDIERELINSGKVRFVASKDERDEIRSEREDQQSNATDDSAKALAAETGADFMLQGTISSVTDAVEGKRAIFYQVDMELIHLENNEKVWIGSKQVKKIVTQSKAGW